MPDESISQIQRAWQIMSRQSTLPAFDEKFRNAAGLSLSIAERVALGRLHDHASLRISELAHLTGVDVSTMSRTLRRLSDAGLVNRQHGEDLRAVRVSISEAGRDAVARAISAGQAMLAVVLAEWSSEDRDELARLMTRFAEDFAGYWMAAPEPLTAAGGAR